MKRLIFFSIVLVSSLKVISQNPSANSGFEWLKTIGHLDFGSGNRDLIEDIFHDQWGNIYVAGTINSELKQDSNGTFILNGVHYSPKHPSLGFTDLFVAKYSSTGQKIWFKIAGSKLADGYYDMDVDKLGNIYLAGNFLFSQDTAYGFDQSILKEYESGAFISKLDSAGNLIWHQGLFGDTLSGNIFNRVFFTSISELFIDSNSIKCVINGGSFRNGSFNSALYGIDTIQTGYNELEFDLSGNYLGYRKFPFPVQDKQPTNSIIERDENGNYFFTSTQSYKEVITSTDTIPPLSNQSFRALILGFNNALGQTWNYFQTNPNFSELPRATYLEGDTLFTLIDYSTDNMSSISYGSFSQNLPQGIFNGAGLVAFDINSGNVVGFIHRTNFPNHRANVQAVYVDQNYIAIGGSYTGNPTFSSTDTLSNASNLFGFFAVFERNGNFLHQQSIPTDGGISITDIAIKDSSLYLAGNYGTNVVLNGVDSIYPNHPQDRDLFFTKYNLSSQSTTGINPIMQFTKSEKGLIVFPNPCQDNINILGKPIHHAAKLYDAKGKLVRTFSLNPKVTFQNVKLNGLKKGHYFMHIIGESESQRLKILKE